MRRSCWGSPVHALAEKQKGCVGCICCPPVPLTRNIQSQCTVPAVDNYLQKNVRLRYLLFYQALQNSHHDSAGYGFTERMAGRDLCVCTVGPSARSRTADKTRLGYLWLYSSESCRPQRLETPSAPQAASFHAAPPSAEKAFPNVQLEAPKLWPVSPALLPPATSQESLDPPPSHLGTSTLLLGPLSASRDQAGSHRDMVCFVQLIPF